MKGTPESAGKHPQPRWGLLYLALPLAGGLFYLIERGHPSGFFRSAEQVGALLLTVGYVELWRRSNALAFLHHPLYGHYDEPLYVLRDGAGPEANESEAGSPSHPVAGFYSELFSAPLHRASPWPDNNSPAGREDIRATPAPRGSAGPHDART
jgi:hypothetical protein